jgi:pimeloyl-ACP methyl ester carboxylesterase
LPTALIESATGSIELYYEDTGRGFPLVWCHEFGGDYRSWEPQVRYFARRYRVITWNYRGYPPSQVPTNPDAYSVEIVVNDLRALLQHLGIERAHVGGLSMGGGVALNFGIRYPEMAASLIIASAGSGTVDHEAYVRDAERQAQMYEARGGEAKAEYFSTLPSRRGFAEKDPRG